MKRMTKRAGASAACILFVIFMIAAAAFAILLPEASGKKTGHDGKLTVDYSNASEGYIMVKGPKTKKKLKVRVKKGDQTLNYDLNGNSEYEVFPLQYGNGKYQIILYGNVSGNRYAEEGRINISIEMENELSCFLYPNQYVNYDGKTEAAVTAEEICRGLDSETEKWNTVCGYIKQHFTYDFRKAFLVQKGTLPDIDTTWKEKMGICQDLSAVTVCMLRTVGVPARLNIGTVGPNNFHAWVTAVVDGEEKMFDPTAEAGGITKNQKYTTDRCY